jgi:hypothetical protein
MAPFDCRAAHAPEPRPGSTDAPVRCAGKAVGWAEVLIWVRPTHWPSGLVLIRHRHRGAA